MVMKLIRHKNDRSISRIILIAAILLLSAAAASCTEVKPGGPVLPYKIVKHQVNGIDAAQSHEIHVVAYTQDAEELQFVAQDIIIKENRKKKNIHGITVGFYQNGPTAGSAPLASMTWVKKEPTGLATVGIQSKDPFESGTWDWVVTDPDAANPALIVKSVKIGKKSELTIAGQTKSRAHSISYIVLDPQLQAVAKVRKAKQAKNGGEFDINWNPPARFRPVEGDYTIRIIASKKDGKTTSELLVKVDLFKKKWNPPAELILY